jgi:hypothetical protein
MIDNLIRKKQQVKQFLLDYEKALGDNILSSSDWDYQEKTHAFLQPFTSTTLWTLDVTATLSQNLMIMDILLRRYEERKVSSLLSPDLTSRFLVLSLGAL